MRYYELMVLFSPNLTDEDEKEQVNQIEELLRSQEGTIHLVDHWGKRKLAYPVKKNRQGFYEWFYFEMEPGRVAEVDRKLRMSESILRFLMFAMEKAQIQEFQRDLVRRKEVAQPVQQEVAAPVAEDTAAGPVESAQAETEAETESETSQEG